MKTVLFFVLIARQIYVFKEEQNIFAPISFLTKLKNILLRRRKRSGCRLELLSSRLLLPFPWSQPR